jgi:hypothetical protein
LIKILRVAVQRGILSNRRGEYWLDRAGITDYTQDECIAAVVAAIPQDWIGREEAIHAAYRYLGFLQTGPVLHESFQSAINGAIRRGLLECDRKMIRKVS